MSVVNEYDWKNRIEDVGEIVGCTFSVYYGPWIAIKTKEWEYHCCCKPTFAVGQGTLSVTKESVDSGERYSHLVMTHELFLCICFYAKNTLPTKKLKKFLSRRWNRLSNGCKKPMFQLDGTFMKKAIIIRAT